MNISLSLSVIQRILCGFSILLLLLLMTAVSGFWGVHKIEDKLNTLTGDVASINQTTSELKENLSAANSTVLQYLLSKSPDSLEVLSTRFLADKQGFLEASASLATQLKSLNLTDDVVIKIHSEVDDFFVSTDLAFSNHKKALNTQIEIAEENVYFKSSLVFLTDDLGFLQEDPAFEVSSSASYILNNIKNLQVSIVDYFDAQDLDTMQTLRSGMATTIDSIKSKLPYLKSENIDDLINQLESDILSDAGIISKYYDNTRLEQESEELAKTLSASMDRIDTQVDALLGEIAVMSDSAKNEANSAASLSTFMIGVVLCISVVIAVFVAVWVSRSIRVPLKEVMSVLGKISDGDFTQRSHVKTKDEFGELSGWVNGLVSKLQSVMTEIDQSASAVEESANGNVSLAHNSKRLMGSQNQRTSEVASSMTDMASTVEQVAKSSEIILHQIQSVDETASRNRAQMDDNIQKMEKLLAQIEESTAVVNELDEHSKNIDNILDVIQEIAEQTNLLALNAAIEAARAGEQGRGFAVVADEVRTLATRTHSSTEEIQNVIVKLQQGVTKTVASMSESRVSANDSVEEARRVGSSLSELQGNMIDIRDLSTQIATAAEEQSAVAQEIRQNIVEISDTSEEAARGSDESAQSSEGLSQLASRQKQLLSQFKIL